MLGELDRIVLNSDVPASALKAGDVGTIVHVYDDAKAYEVEFLTLDGHTAAVITLDADAVRAVSSDEITHARTLAAGSLEPLARVRAQAR